MIPPKVGAAFLDDPDMRYLHGSSTILELSYTTVPLPRQPFATMSKQNANPHWSSHHPSPS